MLPNLSTALLVETADIECLSDSRNRLLVRSHIVVKKTKEKTTNLTNGNRAIVIHLKGALYAFENLYEVREEILVKIIAVIEVIFAFLQPGILAYRVKEDLNRVE